MNEILVAMATKLSEGQKFYKKKHSQFDILKHNYLPTAKVYMKVTYSD